MEAATSRQTSAGAGVGWGSSLGSSSGSSSVTETGTSGETFRFLGLFMPMPRCLTIALWNAQHTVSVAVGSTTHRVQRREWVRRGWAEVRVRYLLM